MSALGDEIKAMIASDGPITLERYMELALGHSEHGYYMGRDHFGAGNKYITPMIADGKVFAATTNSVAIFGLLP